ncbi:MAG TPA: flagellar basal body rod protein FlgC [Geothrix sp.]|nr:flagellar basal body rod protein FlgC [Geothrix sp.]
MDYTQTFAISAAGMAVERARIEVAALNLANANSIQTEGGTSFQPLRVVVRTMQAGLAAPGEFANQVDAGLNESAAPGWNLNLPQVAVAPSGAEPRSVYEPSNPFANAKGFVTYPGVDTATEMVNMMSALRSYEANVAAMNTAKTMALKALDIGGAS